MLGPLEREMNGRCGQMGNGMGYSSSSSEEEASALPVHTKVVVTGNNRTKSVLIGLQGVVKKAVGLGGWHWLVLLICLSQFLFSFLSSLVLGCCFCHFVLFLFFYLKKSLKMVNGNWESFKVL